MKVFFSISALCLLFFGWLPRAAAGGESADNTLFVYIGLGQSLMVGSQAGDTLVSVEPVWPQDVLMFATEANADVRMGLVTTGGANRIAVLEYALSPQASTRVPEYRVRGNVRDSAASQSALDGRPLHNWGVHQRVPVQTDP